MQRYLRAIDEDIFLSRVAMHVYKRQDVFGLSTYLLATYILWCVSFRPISQKVANFLNSSNRWMQAAVRSMILAVQVVTTHGSSVVSGYDSIRIDHRNDFEHNSLSQLNCRV